MVSSLAKRAAEPVVMTVLVLPVTMESFLAMRAEARAITLTQALLPFVDSAMLVGMFAVLAARVQLHKKLFAEAVDQAMFRAPHVDLKSS
ncbi:hypothetical protein BDW_06235 [Bdellovibrio bacteriovorus W]|nr:hypothetical protein BDW_06235 [Bdellovibrio bacteriovorus W]